MKRPAAPIRLPKAHRVVTRTPGRKPAVRWYRRRGGELLMKFEGATLAEALAAEAAGAAQLAAAYAAPIDRSPSDDPTVGEIVTAYRAASDGFGKLAASTASQWARWLDRIVEEFGDLEASALGAKGARRAVLDWRERWAKTPRTADYGVQVLQRLLSWAVEHEHAEANPAEGIKALYEGGRADVIVEPDELKRILGHATPALANAIRLAATTGLRRGDLVDVKDGEVSEFSIERRANKGRRKRVRVLVPLLDDARQVVAEIRASGPARLPAAYLLTTARGRPWSEHWLTESWIAAARAAGVDKHFHDLRGTACTAFILGGLSDEQIAEIFGWEPARVRRIRRRYVDRERIARGVIAQLERGAEK